MGDEDCKVCKLKIRDMKEAVCCDSCRDYMHTGPVKEKNCSGLSTTELRAMVLQNRNIIFFCNDCRDAFRSVPLLIRQITEIKNDVKTLKNDVEILKNDKIKCEMEIASLKATQNSTSLNSNSNSELGLNMCEILAEISEREARKKNIIIFGLPESQAKRQRFLL
ncbi:unnamed protein product [Phaedon cochleariae]|uniref:Uncharacterized protein n=1 Tax=Phaedon cochleariae TaxID=80249 RepID=A0A9N9SK96_PHACE|nr:unnamed protein product [Phaedon cochleariae]